MATFREVVCLFNSCCMGYTKKMKNMNKDEIVKPIIFRQVKERAQVDLVNWSSCLDPPFKYILCYQDNFSKFIQLRPLASKLNSEVRFHLFNIFCLQGPPSILQSDNGPEFVAKLIKELVTYFPDVKIINGKARKPPNPRFCRKSKW